MNNLILHDLKARLVEMSGREVGLRIMQGALAVLAGNSKVSEAATNDPEGFMNCIMSIAARNLMPGSEAYVVVFYSKAKSKFEFQTIISYKGLISIFARNGITITRGIHYEGDKFSCDPARFEISHPLPHGMNNLKSDGKPTTLGFYVIARSIKTGNIIAMQYITAAEGREYVQQAIERGGASTKIWRDYPEAMVLKTIVHRYIAKVLDTSVLSNSLSIESDGVGGDVYSPPETEVVGWKEAPEAPSKVSGPEQSTADPNQEGIY